MYTVQSIIVYRVNHTATSKISLNCGKRNMVEQIVLQYYRNGVYPRTYSAIGHMERS